jgi:predicted MFS family arabinose efflux permease
VPSGAPELLGAFAVTPARAAGWTLFAFGALAVVLEPPLLAIAHGRRERPLRTAGLAVMALATLAAALAPSHALLLAALALYGPASGLGTSLAESALVAAHPGRREAILARWSLLGLVGDLIAPAALALSVALGLGWRGALLAAGAVAAAQVVLALRAPAAAADDRAAPSPRRALRAALACPRLLGWSLAAVPCALMDEVLVAFGALWLAGRLGCDATERAAVLTAGVVGAAAGAALLERLAGRLRASTLLALSGLGCAVAYGAWLAATSWITSALALAATGLFAAAHHPLLRARAFAAMPDRPHVVLAAGASFGALELALPLVVGVVADRAGLLAAVVLLLGQPVAVLGAAAAARREEAGGADGAKGRRS